MNAASVLPATTLKTERSKTAGFLFFRELVTVELSTLPPSHAHWRAGLWRGWKWLCASQVLASDAGHAPWVGECGCRWLPTNLCSHMPVPIMPKQSIPRTWLSHCGGVSTPNFLAVGARNAVWSWWGHSGLVSWVLLGSPFFAAVKSVDGSFLCLPFIQVDNAPILWWLWSRALAF